MAETITCDVAIVGGGLAGGLVALALKGRHAHLDVRLIDADSVVGGNHIWSFFGSDVAPEHRWMVAPLVAHAWPRYDIAFPQHARVIDEAYYAIRSEKLDAAVRGALPPHALMLGRKVLGVSAWSLIIA